MKRFRNHEEKHSLKKWVEASSVSLRLVVRFNTRRDAIIFRWEVGADRIERHVALQELRLFSFPWRTQIAWEIRDMRHEMAIYKKCQC